MRRRVLVVVVAALSLASLPAAASNHAVKVMLNGKRLTYPYEPQPHIHNGRVYVPIREVVAALGGTVAWDEATQTVTAEAGRVTVDKVKGLNPKLAGLVKRDYVPGMGWHWGLPGSNVSLVEADGQVVAVRVAHPAKDGWKAEYDQPEGKPVTLDGAEVYTQHVWLGPKMAKVKLPDNRASDLHGFEERDRSQLTLFLAGNQFMVMPELIEAFKKKHPEIQVVFYETLPPGLLLQQIMTGGATFQGQDITGMPDVYASVTADHMKVLKEAGLIDDWKVYIANRLVLMVPEGNPKGIKGVADLARADVRVSQPNPVTEGIALNIMQMYRDVGGEALNKRIMEEKKAEGTTFYTNVHHRETPERLEAGLSDVGPVWLTEYVEARKQGRKVEMVEPGEKYDQRDKVRYVIAVMKDAPHKEAARKYLEFVLSEEGQQIYAKYGFVPAAER